MSPLIEIENLSHDYRIGEVVIHSVRDVSLRLETGDFVAIVGASGSGKTSLLNILGCLERPTAGRYLLAGQDVALCRSDELARLRNEFLGFVFQSFNLMPRTTALENVELPLLCSRKRLSLSEARKLALAALTRVGLEHRAGHFPSQLSGGQQQRVGIARALVNSPKIILADEPTGNLDTHTSAEMMALFKELNAEGVTIIMVTHDPDVASQCNRVIVMSDGQFRGERRIRERSDKRDKFPSLLSELMPARASL